MGNEEIKKQRSEKYFTDASTPQTQTGSVDDLSEKIALRISLSNIEKNAGYNIQLFSVINGVNTPLNQSENL